MLTLHLLDNFMTAEIAILNKSAVALAADSAVTISAGSSQEKIYDSADKLFELSCNDPIGVMINNDMNFMEVPLPVLIKKYRSKKLNFAKIPNAAMDFLQYLNEFGLTTPEAVNLRHLSRQIAPLIDLIQNRSQEALAKIFYDRPFAEVVAEQVANEIRVVRRLLERSKSAKFISEGEVSLSDIERAEISKIVSTKLTSATDEQRAEVCKMILENFDKVGWTPSTTGIVVAGFGREDLFPTLISFEIYGMIAGSLKYIETNNVDVDRNGDRAKVIPFAQKEMVERFLYGLDEGIERKIKQFCQSSVPEIANKLILSLELPEDERKALIAEALDAEKAFLEGLAEKSFEAIRRQSQSEIEDMVEFMPKPEMAKMAEALVNLTSIKRRVVAPSMWPSFLKLKGSSG
jgi:hypothetical protein